MITIAEIEKLAALSRLELTEGEKAKFQKEIEAILAYVGQIKELGGNAERALGEVKNVLRADGDSHTESLYTEAILNNAPKREGQYLKVKKIL